MSSIARPTPAQQTRRWIVLGAAAFAILTPAAQAVMGWGQDQRAFAADGDDTLRVASYAFSIWGVIYAALSAYAVRQALPATGESDLIRALGWPSAAAFVGIGLWIVAAALDWELATIILIFGSALALILPLAANGAGIRALSRFDRDRLLTVWPLGMLAGWLTIAAPLNLITVLTGNEDLSDAISPIGWAVLAILAVMTCTLAITARIRSLSYPLPVAWGLVGAFVAEQDRDPALAFSALGAAVAVLVLSVILVFALRPDRTG